MPDSKRNAIPITISFKEIKAPNLLFCLLLLVCFILPSTPSYASSYVKSGEVCHRVGRRNIELCRPPKYEGELDKVRERRKAYSAYYDKKQRCEFSGFRTWSAERSRLRGKLETARSSFSYWNQELNWAQRDISRAEYLPSETLREAYASLSLFAPLVAEAKEDIRAFSWCLECARVEGDCSDLD